MDEMPFEPGLSSPKSPNFPSLLPLTSFFYFFIHLIIMSTDEATCVKKIAANGANSIRGNKQ